MYEEPSPLIEKTIEKAVNVIIEKCKNVHPLDLEKILFEIYGEYSQDSLNTPYHKKYYPFLLSLIDGAKRSERKKEINQKKKDKIKEAMLRRKEL